MEDYDAVRHRLSLQLARLATKNAKDRLATMLAHNVRRQGVAAEQLVSLEHIVAWLEGDPKAMLSTKQRLFCEGWVSNDDKMRFRWTVVVSNVPEVLRKPLPKRPPGM